MRGPVVVYRGDYTVANSIDSTWQPWPQFTSDFDYGFDYDRTDGFQAIAFFTPLEEVDGSPYRGMAPKAKLVFAKVLGSNGGTDVQVMEEQHR